MAVCHYDGILRSREEDVVYIEGERIVVLVDSNFKFDHFKSQLRSLSGSGSTIIKTVHSLKYEAKSVCTQVPIQEDLNAMSYLHDLYNVNRIPVYAVKTLGESWNPSLIEAK